nr:mediator of RNA polymerase II transcription subunit 4-like [Ipomoea batatas]
MNFERGKEIQSFDKARGYAKAMDEEASYDYDRQLSDGRLRTPIEQNIAADTVTSLSQGKTPNLVVMDLDSEQLKSISNDGAFGIPQKRMMATNVGSQRIVVSGRSPSSTRPETSSSRALASFLASRLSASLPLPSLPTRVSATAPLGLSSPLRTQPGSKMPQNVPHQILQSPARLGLPTPNSPSVQNPPSPKVSSQVSQSYPRQQANLLNTTSTSLTLLSLLPPLSRAQSLLIQMASLASRLFEVSPNRNQWVSAFRGALPSFLPSQLQASQQTPPDSCPSSTKEILSLFNSLQSQLFEAVAELQEILDLQDAKQRLSREIRSKDSAILAFAHKLKDAERVLDMLVDDYSDYCRPKRAKSEDNPKDSSLTTVATQLKLSDILSYAHRISYSTFAPPEFGAGTAPLRGALPPAPQEEQMRASQLYSFADHDVGLPKTDEGKEKIIEPLIEPSIAQPMEVNHLPNLSSIQGLFPSNIVVPSGWKPGMPVELPTDLPLPPPGWKPGDPIPLPPLDSLSLPPKVEEPPIRPLPPPGLPKMPETIQVRHVQLDIDDDSSDYSSEGASSESED